MKIIFFSCFLLSLVFSAYCQTETQLKAQLKNDPVFIKYNKARLGFFTGVIENKWGYGKADKVMIKNGRKHIKNYKDLQELYRKAGVDSGYLIVFNNMYYTKAMVAKKYKAVIKSNPGMWKKVTNGLTSSVPKPPRFN